jgi:hypothetical protein
MSRFVSSAAVALICATSVACGPGRPKVNVAKLATVSKLAVVGVCGTSDAGWFDGSSPNGRQAGFGDALLPHVAEGFDQGLRPALGRAEVTPLASVTAVPDVPKATGMAKNFSCASGFSPFLPKGRTSLIPDIMLMRSMAEKLGVDAVIAVVVNPVVRTEGGGARVTAGSWNPVSVYVVDRSGEAIMRGSLKDIESAKAGGADVTHAYSYSEASIPAAAMKVLGNTFGQALATRVAAAMSGQD